MSEELRTELLGLGKQVVISVVLFALGLFFGGNTFQAFLVACVPYGWKVLNRITPNIFISMPWVGWLMYFVTKVAIAAIIGIFALAYTWIKCIIKVIIAYKRQA